MTQWFEDDAFWSDYQTFIFRGGQLSDPVRDVDRSLRLAAPLPASAAVLDLCCGPGRHTLELARRGFRVTGVDRTAAYLAEAEHGAAAAGLAVELVREDMRTFRRPGAFDAAFNLYTSFGYFPDPADDRRVAENLFASLRFGGVLVMELMSREVLASGFRPRDWSRMAGPDSPIVLEERRLSQDWAWIESDWTLLFPDGRTQTRTVGHRLYSGTELAALLRGVGFAPVTLHGGLDGRPYDHTAWRLVVVARKG